MKRITIEIQDSEFRALARLVERLNADRNDPYNSHGALTLPKLGAMLLEDAAMVETRPGSWEGAGMAEVLRSHGYKA